MFHVGDELSYIKACELGAELGATAVSHCEHVSTWKNIQHT